MKTEYFATAEHKEKAREVAQSWVGVPYEDMGRSRTGVDCVGFVGLLLAEIGLLDHLEKFDYYPHDWYLKKQNLMVETIEHHLSHCLATGISGNEVTGAAKLGDLVCLKCNAAVVNHTVFAVTDYRIIHATPYAGVVLDDLQRWKKNIVHVYRFYEGVE